MSIIYALIADEKKNVLADIELEKSNFPGISRLILQKIEKNGKFIINYDKYKIHYIYEDNLIFLLLSENIEDKKAFSFLNEVKEDAISIIKEINTDSTTSPQFDSLKKLLEQMTKYYGTDPFVTKHGQVINTLNLAKDAMIENIESLLDRDVKTDIIIQKSEEIKGFSMNMSNFSENIKKQQESERKNKYIIYGVIIIGIVIILYLFFFRTSETDNEIQK